MKLRILFLTYITFFGLRPSINLTTFGSTQANFSTSAWLASFLIFIVARSLPFS
jgi:hypothetical protein